MPIFGWDSGAQRRWGAEPGVRAVTDADRTVFGTLACLRSEAVYSRGSGRGAVDAFRPSLSLPCQM
jgi:hypothetical protein